VGVVAPVSCIVSDPAEYGVAKQSPRFLDARNAKPSVLHHHPLDLGQTFSVNVPVRSEDTGDELFLDYGIVGKRTLLGFRELAPGKFEESRSIDIPAEILLPGCHAVSLVVTHRSNLTENNEPIRSDDTAILTWWVNVDDDGSNLMSECPAKGAD
jgi:hypothetical protein